MSVATAYCTEADMQRLFSAPGVVAFADHDASGTSDSGVVSDCIDQATEEINLCAMQFYSAAGLATSVLVNRWCTYLAVFYLCERRGNSPPESIANECQRISERLERVRTGELKIPGLAYKSDFRPSFSNLTIDRRYPFSRVRVIPQSSDNIATTLVQKQIDPAGPISPNE